MNKKLFSTFFAVTICLSTLLTNNSNAQTQSAIAHLNPDGSTTLLVSMDTLEQAFAEDCNMDSVSTYYGATFDTVYVLYTSESTYSLIGNGSNMTNSMISRGFFLTLDINNNLKLAVEAEEAGTCSGCDMCVSDGCCGCKNLCGSGGNQGTSCSHGDPANARQPGYIGNFY